MALGNLEGAGRRTLYVSGEESAAQIRLRAERLPGARAAGAGAGRDRPGHGAGDAGRRAARGVRDRLGADAARGRPDRRGRASVGQVREVADRITRLAKARGIAVLLVGHVTKEGALAGPRVLEHLVDCVLQFEGERERTYRTLRALKNRFGSTNDVGVFEMRSRRPGRGRGRLARASSARPRARPGASCWPRWRARGRCWSRCRRSSRRPSSCRRGGSCNGIDRNRLALVLAVLGRHAGIGAGSADVFVNVAGGVRVDEPGADLAVALAVASAVAGRDDGRARRRWRASARSG